MNIHITNVNNLGGTAAVAQKAVIRAAKTLGFREMGMFKRNFYEDYWSTINHQIDGSISGVNFYNRDIVIFQYPSWNTLDYDRTFVDKIKQYHGVKLIIFVHDIQGMMFNSINDLLKVEIEILNRADLLILPSQKMKTFLNKYGLDETIPVLYQKIWDNPGYPCFLDHHFERKLWYIGAYDLQEYHGKTIIEQFFETANGRKDDESYRWRGYLEPVKLMREISKGGFGLIWCGKEYFERYYSLNQPHKVGFNLSAGIPVIIREGSVHSDFIKANGLGFSVQSLEEADQIVQDISPEKYEQLIQNVAKYQSLLLEGIYTKKLLLDAVIQVMEK